MSSGNKPLLFLLGLAVGLLAGAGFFIFKMDNLLKDINLFRTKKDTVIVRQEISGENSAQQGKNNYKKYFPKDTTRKSMSSAELFAKKYSNEVSVKKVMDEADSLLMDSVPEIISSEIYEENVVVRKDELLESKTIKVFNLDTVQNLSAQEDTVPEKISGIKNTKNVSGYMKVEFWKSPVNYKGYKMTKNKIVLFGISPSDAVQLFMHNEVFFLKQKNNVFKIQFTDDFMQFEKITDPELISRLMK